jgi:uncharacterized delta-60 repeat protein
MIVDLRSRLPFDDREERDSFSVVVRNTTTSTVYANILGATTNLKDNSNATTSYVYNLIGETFATNSISIQYRVNTQPAFQTATLALNQQNIEGVVFALNQLGIGTWFYNGTNVVTYNNEYIFGTLVITPTTSYSGQINTSFITAGFNSPALDIIQQPDGKFICVGGFSSYDGNASSGIARINSDGTYDSTFIVGTGFLGGTPSSVVIQNDGKVIVVGTFTSYNGNPSDGIVRINTNGSYDATFVVGTGFAGGICTDVLLQSDGKVIVIGAITSYNGNPSSGIVRINTNGSYDATFVVGTGFGIANPISCVIQSDGKIVVGGNIVTYNGNSINQIVRINTNGSYDNTFVSGTGFVGGFPLNVQLQSDSKILVGGTFASYDGNSSAGIVRINTNGSYDNTFSVGIGVTGGGNDVYGTCIQANGKIIAVGDFTAYNGSPSINIVRINTNGSYDSTFTVGTGFNNICNKCVYDSTLNTITGVGAFTDYDGTVVGRIAQIYTVSPA